MLGHFLTHAFGLLWHMPHYLQIAFATAVYAWVRRWWIQRQQRLLSEEARNWPTFRGRVVAVQALRDGHGEHKGEWYGLLTYSYILDEVEIGEYRQYFSSEAEADDWVRGLRDKTVTVAVDPRNKLRSIWISDEVKAAQEAAKKTLLESETAELAWWLEALRIGTLTIAVVGAVMAGMVEVQELMAMYGRAAAVSGWLAGGLTAAAFVCSGVAGYVFAKRFPGSKMGDLGKRLKDPVIEWFLKGLGVIQGTLFFGLWLGSAEGHWFMNRLAWNTVFLGLGLASFASAAVALWVVGRRSARIEHELAPGRRAQDLI